MKILVLIFLLCGYAAQSQVMQTTGPAGGLKLRAAKADTMLIAPFGSDTSNIGWAKWGVSTTGALFVKTADSSLWYRINNKWHKLGGTAGQISDSSYFRRLPYPNQGFASAGAGNGGTGTSLGTALNHRNIAIGDSAMRNITNGYGNTAIGYRVFQNATTAFQNIGIGYGSMMGNAAGFTGFWNIGIGSFNGASVTLNGITSGRNNIAIGHGMFGALSSGSFNVGIGNTTVGISTGSYNTIVGEGAAYGSTNASNNTAVGYYAWGDFSTGDNMTALGYYALGSSGTGNTYNIGIGVNAGATTTNSTYNNVLGNNSGKKWSGADYNIVIGDGLANGSGAAIGASGGGFGTNFTGDYNIHLGATVIDTTGSNQLAIGRNNIRWIAQGVSGSTRNTVISGSTSNITALVPSAALAVTSTTAGFLPPVMTGAQAEAISSPAEGLMIYCNNGNGSTITSKGWWGYDGTTWVKLN